MGDLDDAVYKLATIDSDTRNQIDGFKAKISEIDEKLAAGEAHGSIVIRAPASGVVADIVGRPGQVLGAGSTMLTIVPAHAQMRAVLLAPSSAIGFVHHGQRVLMLYSAFPYQKFGEQPGTVVSIAQAAADPDQTKAPLRRQPAGQDRYLLSRGRRAGQTVCRCRWRASRLARQHAGRGLCAARSAPALSVDLQPLDAFGRAAHQG
jgi:multidrug efflux pump subunit AcrA (membrane-fusion protein)